MLGRDLIGVLAQLLDEIPGDLGERTIRAEADGCQPFCAGDPRVQHVARNLQDGLGEGVIELQLVGARRVVDREFTGMDDSVAAVTVKVVVRVTP